MRLQPPWSLLPRQISSRAFHIPLKGTITRRGPKRESSGIGAHLSLLALATFQFESRPPSGLLTLDILRKIEAQKCFLSAFKKRAGSFGGEKKKSLTAHNTDVGYPTYLQINHSVAKHFHFWCQAMDIYLLHIQYSVVNKINE